MPKLVKKYTETQYFRHGFLRRLHATYSLYNFNTESVYESDTEKEIKEKKKSKHG